MFARWLISAAVAASVGCGGLAVDQSKVVAPPPRADEAVAAVAAFYGIDRLPTVYWYGGAVLNCVDPARPWCDGGHCWLSDNGDGCTPGEQEDSLILVSDWGGGVPISAMSMGGEAVLPHEMAHLRWGDPNHNGHAFADGGEVEQATALLAAAGM